MRQTFKYLIRIAVLAVLALVGYALIGDLPPPTRQMAVELPLPETGR